MLLLCVLSSWAWSLEKMFWRYCGDLATVGLKAPFWDCKPWLSVELAQPTNPLGLSRIVVSPSAFHTHDHHLPLCSWPTCSSWIRPSDGSGCAANTQEEKSTKPSPWCNSKQSVLYLTQTGNLFIQCLLILHTYSTWHTYSEFNGISVTLFYTHIWSHHVKSYSFRSLGFRAEVSDGRMKSTFPCHLCSCWTKCWTV